MMTLIRSLRPSLQVILKPDERALPVLVFFLYAVRESWRFWPDGDISPFPFSGVVIDGQTYIWMAWVYLFFLGMSRVMYVYADQAKEFFNAVFILAALEFVEFLCNYNQPWGYIYTVPINLTTLRYPFLLYFFIRTYTLCKN